MIDTYTLLARQKNVPIVFGTLSRELADDVVVKIGRWYIKT